MIMLPAGVSKVHQHDHVWRMWRILIDHAEALDNAHVSEYVTQSLRMYVFGFTKGARASRSNLLYYSALSCARRKVMDSPSELDHKRVINMIASACATIDIVFDDIMENVEREEEGGDTRLDATGGRTIYGRPPQQPHMAPYSQPPYSQPYPFVQPHYSQPPPLLHEEDVRTHNNASSPTIEYLKCYTTFDDKLRCELADERRDAAHDSKMTLKNVTISDMPKKLAMITN